MFWKLLVLLVVVATPLFAQEKLVPLDDRGTIRRIDRDLEQKLDLFPDIRDFVEARLYQAADSSFTLEISYGPDSAQQRIRRPLTGPQVDELRRDVTRKIGERSAAMTIDQEGRTRLITGTTALGLGLYGWAMPLALDVEETKSFVAVYMLTAAASFFIPYVATTSAPVTKAQANMALYGGLAGVGHGVLLYNLFAGDDDLLVAESGPLAAGMALGVAEAYAGYLLAGSHHLSEGKSGMIAGVGTLGLGFGAGAAYLVGGDQTSPAAYSAAMLLGNGAGFFVGNTLANMQPYTAGDAQVTLTAALLGAYVPPAALVAANLEGDEEVGRAYVSAAMLGAAAGTYLGTVLVNGREFTDAQANYISLGTVAGGALGLGLTYLLASDEVDNARAYAASSALGGIGGFALMYSLLEDDARVDKMGSRLRFDVSPAGLMALATGTRSKLGVPVVGVGYSF